MKPIEELKKAIVAELDADYMQPFIDDLVEAVKANVFDAVNNGLCDSGYTQTCINCVHFDEPKEHCTLNGCNQRPPARVIAFGCEQFKDASEAIAENVRGLIPVNDFRPRDNAQKAVGEVPNDPWDDLIPF